MLLTLRHDRCCNNKSIMSAIPACSVEQPSEIRPSFLYSGCAHVPSDGADGTRSLGLSVLGSSSTDLHAHCSEQVLPGPGWQPALCIFCTLAGVLLLHTFKMTPLMWIIDFNQTQTSLRTSPSCTGGCDLRPKFRHRKDRIFAASYQFNNYLGFFGMLAAEVHLWPFVVDLCQVSANSLWSPIGKVICKNLPYSNELLSKSVIRKQKGLYNLNIKVPCSEKTLLWNTNASAHTETLFDIMMQQLGFFFIHYVGGNSSRLHFLQQRPRFLSFSWKSHCCSPLYKRWDLIVCGQMGAFRRVLDL